MVIVHKKPQSYIQSASGKEQYRYRFTQNFGTDGEKSREPITKIQLRLFNTGQCYLRSLSRFFFKTGLSISGNIHTNFTDEDPFSCIS